MIVATNFILADPQTRRTRVKKIARPQRTRISPNDVVDRLYAQFPLDMARLAE